MIEKREFIYAQTAFDPEAVQMLAFALDVAWDRVQKSGSRFARPAYARATREVLAKRIIEAAQRGEKDKQKLAADAVKFLAANYMDSNVGRRTAARRGGSEVPEGRSLGKRAYASARPSALSQSVANSLDQPWWHRHAPDE